MTYIYIIFVLLTLFLTKNTLFKKQKLTFKIIIYLFILVLCGLITLLFFVYLWKSTPDYNEQKQIINSWNIKILNNFNIPIKDALIIENNNHKDTITSNNEGYVNLYKLKSNSVIVEAKGYVSDTIYLDELTDNKIYLLKSNKK